MKPLRPEFKETTLSVETKEFGPRRCRHVRSGEPPFRQLYEWAAKPGCIIGTERYHVLLCITCARMLQDFAEPEPHWPI